MNNLYTIALHYIWGLFAAMFNGGIAAIVGTAGVDSAAKFDPKINALNLHTVIAIFVSAAVWSGFWYFKANPLPSKLPDGVTSAQAAMQSVLITKASLIAVIFTLGLSGCAGPGGSTPSATVKAIFQDPNKDAKAAEGIVAAVANRVLAKNPGYSDALAAVAVVFSGLAQSNAGILTASDVQAILSKTSISDATQSEIAADFTVAQGIFLSDFDVNLPTFKPIYALFLQAVANGLYIATGKPAPPLPVIPYTAAPAA